MRDRNRDAGVKRANRQLAKSGQKLVVARGQASIREFGPIYKIDIESKRIIETNVELGAIFRNAELQQPQPQPEALAATA